MENVYPAFGDPPGVFDPATLRPASDRTPAGRIVMVHERASGFRRPQREAARRADGRYARKGKRLLDIALVLASLPITLPVVAISALLIKCGGGDAFYTQRRLGLNGRSFNMLKLCTMVPNADRLLQEHLARDPELRREWDRTQKLKNDPRITRLGRFLRRTSIDELPQLWNVLAGNMSIVGPRPMMPQQAELYGDLHAYVAFRPGLTGMWQVMERNESDFDSRALADRRYAGSCSMRTDLKLIVRTVGVVLDGTGY